MNKCDVVLVNPFFNIFETFNNNHSKKTSHAYLYPPLGISYIASSLLKNNIDVKIIDSVALNLNIKRTVDSIIRYQPRVIGITVSTHTLNTVYRLIKAIRLKYNKIIIVGGPHITYDPNMIISLNADYGIIGEGEEVIPIFVKKILSGSTVEEVTSSITGIATKIGKSINKTKPAIISNIDNLPIPARHLLPQKKYYFSLFSGKFTTVVTTRGCIFDCVYCALPNKRSYRMRSVNSVIKELEILDKLKYSYIDFQDDLFTYNKNRTLELCKRMIKNKFNFSWGCATRIDMIDKELLTIMKNAGCHNIRYGIESGTEHIRKSFNKNFSNKIIQNIFNVTKKSKIYAIAFFSLGHPGETLKDMRKTFSFAKRLNSDYTQFSIITLLPGSRLFDIAKKDGLVNNSIWNKVMKNGENPFYIPKTVTYNQMVKIQNQAFQYFYMSPKYIIKNILKTRNINDFFQKVRIGFAIMNHFRQNT